jgi:CDP-diacylglycerol--glycerol-3-phosphate 3-phosphatidyltransferase
MIGFFVASAAGAAVAAGHVFYGGLLLLVSGPFDALDGALARTAGLESRFGAFFDSFIDRYSEAVVLLGILCWATWNDRHVLVIVTFLTMTGSLMVSYARARAGGLRISCRVGLFTRLERFIVLTLTLITQQLLAGLIILALLTNFTALTTPCRVDYPCLVDQLYRPAANVPRLQAISARVVYVSEEPSASASKPHETVC